MFRPRQPRGANLAQLTNFSASAADTTWAAITPSTPDFQGLRHRGVVRDRHSHEAAQAASPAYQGRHRDLLGRNARMFGIEPEAVVAARQAKQLDAHRVDQPAGAKDVNQLVGSQQILEKSGHVRSICFGRSELGVTSSQLENSR